MSSASTAQDQVCIEGIDLPLVKDYFRTLNSQDFDGTADLFQENGVLQPPLEEPIVGAIAIAQYLHSEAVGMNFFPKEGSYKQLDSHRIQGYVQGYVETSTFKVNVAWQFLINDTQLEAVAIKLLASWEELAQIQR